ncbi:uncharacterized protein N7482_003472 [Penicillium canariense]|uniref:Uncharacterized protein n=1 Tax=Penicillium canariense TaxID=189055 RepID=A0A9W9I6U9_9EURO|nr:uncharacterized protein N7482_003472 [Penicillium canariense]KAJ5167878.1 hypothetical protein N7482_003472 [Penicillium canariense]
MRRCLCPGRLLRIGRGPIAPRLPVLSHPSVSRVQTCFASTTTRRSITEDEFQLLFSYNTLPSIPLESLRKFNPDSWIPILEKCSLAREKKTNNNKKGGPAHPGEEVGSLLEHEHELRRTHALMGYLWLARTHSNLNILGYLGFELKHWSTVHSYLSQLIDTYETLVPYMASRNALQGFDWNAEGLSLDQLTGKHGRQQKGLIKPHPQSDMLSLDRLTDRPAARELAERFLAEVLLNLGSLVLKAADAPQNEADLAMSCVFRILARLHHLDLISNRVYQYPKNDPSQISFRPPGLNLLSSHIMSVLSDAAWLEHEAALATAATEAGEDPPFLPFKVGVRELGPEIWFELILWCCVEHGFTKQGAGLVKEMSQRIDDKAWKVESWAPLVQALDVVQQTNISTEISWRRPNDNFLPQTFKGPNKPPFNGLGNRTISTEVVASLRSGLINKAYVGVGFHGSTPSDIINYSTPLNLLLESSGDREDLRPTSKSTNWHIFRILESGCLQTYEDPTLFERVLRSTQNVVPPWGGYGALTEHDLSDMTRAQLYDETAAIAGLVEHNVKAYAYKRQAGRSFYQFAWLQNIVDASKAYHIQAFFEQLSRSKSTDVPFFNSQHLGVQEREFSSLPQVSIVTLAELLDLASVNRAYDFGNWLLFNDDLDGPSIPASAYGDQVLAPSVLRFAAATQNTELSEKVISSLSMPLSVNMLKALVSSHIDMGNWDRAIVTLEYLRDFRLKSWGFSNLTALAAKIIRLDASIKHKESSGGLVDERLTKSLERANDLFLRFYRMQFNTPASKNRRVTAFQRNVLMRLLLVFRSLPGPISNLTKQIDLKVPPLSSHLKLQYIPTVSFHNLLAAVVDVYGSTFGLNMWFKWCIHRPPPSRVRQREGGITRLHSRKELSWARGDPTFNPKWLEHQQRKAVIPDFNTIRIIAQAAMREFALLRNPKLQSHPSFSSSPPPRPQQLPFFARTRPYKALISRFEFQGQPVAGGKPPSSPAEASLDFVVCMFIRAGMPQDQIDLEVPGHIARMCHRGIFHNPEKRTRDRIWEIRRDPFMKSGPFWRMVHQKPKGGRGARASSESRDLK